jgi:mannose-6-phosphate isomerase-like protein (cupin superfamily)
MKFIKRDQTNRFENNKYCVAIEYPMGDRDINGAVGIISGRYPTKGRVVNEKCKEMAYVIEGAGRAVIEGKEIKFIKGDLLLIEPGERYYWEGNFEIFMPCTPAWYPEQHKNIV